MNIFDFVDKHPTIAVIIIICTTWAFGRLFDTIRDVNRYHDRNDNDDLDDGEE